MFQKAVIQPTRAIRFRFSDIILNDEKEVQFFIFCGTIAQIFGAKKDLVSVPYLTVLGFYYIVPGEFLGCM